MRCCLLSLLCLSVCMCRCVVDTRYVLQHLEEDSSDGGINEISQQLAFSDLILLNKTDLVDAKQMELVKQEVRRINQSATLHECQLNQEGGRPPLSLLLDNNGFSVNKALKVDPEFLHSDSGSDLDDSDSDSDVGSDGEGAAEAGAPAAAGGEGGVDDVPSQPKAAAAAARRAGRAAAEAEGSSAQACCGSTQQQQAEADSSQLTSATAVNINSVGRKRPASHVHAHAAAHASTGEQLLKVRGELRVRTQRFLPHVGTAQEVNMQWGYRPADLHAADLCKIACLCVPVTCHLLACSTDGVLRCCCAVSPVQGERRPKRRRKQLHDLSGVGSVGIVARGPLDEYRFNMFMRDLLAEKAKDIFRCKGVLAVHVSINTLLRWSRPWDWGSEALRAVYVGMRPCVMAVAVV